MGHFSQRFNNKLLKAHNKALNNRFDSLGQKIKDLTLSDDDQKTILGIIEKKYLTLHEEIRQKALAGTLEPLKEEDPGDQEPEGEGEDNSGSDDLSALLGDKPSGSTAAPAATPAATPAQPAKPAAAAKTGNKDKTKTGKGK